MPFNPDDYLAKKQTANPVGGSAQAFDPNAYMQSKGIQTLPNGGNVQDSQTAADAYRQSNPPTPLSAAVLGFEQGATYNGAEKIANAVDAQSGAAFDVNKQDYPIINALGQLGGAILAPSPVGKLKAIKDAGTLAKMAFNAADFSSRVGLSTFLGSNQPDAESKLNEVKQAFKDPLTLGLGALATLAPALPVILRKSGDVVVKDGKTAVSLGKGMEDALASPEGQANVSRAVGQFENETIQAAQKGISNLGQKMDEIATQNADTTVNIKSSMTKMFDFLKSQKPEELLDKDRVALAKLKNFIEPADQALNGASENASFQDTYELKKNLGRLIFDPKTGAGRTFNNADPSIKRAAINLYGQLADSLSSSDKTKTFKDVSDAFTGTYKVMDAADDIGNSLANMADKLNVSGINKRDALVNAYKSIPPQYLPTMPELGNQILNKMDDTITAYNVAAKIAGQAPQKQNVLYDLISKLPIFSQGSRLNMLNQLGQSSVDRPLTGALGASINAADVLSSPPALSGINSVSQKHPPALKEIQ